MASISQIASVTTSASSALSTIPALGGLILASPQNLQNIIGYQPQSTNGVEVNPPALAFHYEGEQSVALESDITDHYAEDNTALQDQIALRPETITTHGFIGDLNDVPDSPIFGAAQVLAQKLTPLGSFVPGLTATANKAYSTAVAATNTALNAANAGIAAWNSISGGSGTSVISGNEITLIQNQTPQQKYFQQFYAYWRLKTLFTVQTPWAIFTNMAIKSLRAIQDETTRVITDFEVTFKMMRFADTFSAISDLLGTLQGRAGNQNSFIVNLGSSTPSLSPTSLASAVAGVF